MKIKDVIKSGLCIGCGLCTESSDVLEFKYSEGKGQFLPILKTGDSKDEFALCPGMGYDIIELSKTLYSNDYQKERLELGKFISQRILYSKDEEILEYSSSGGALTEISLFLLENNYVEAVINAKFDYSKEREPIAYCSVSKSKEDLLLTQGSKYCPVNYSEVLRYINNIKGKVAIIATPCIIAMLKKHMIQNPEANNKILLTMTNFCGGYKNYNNIKLLAKRKKINYRNIKSFRFRGKGQPGNMEFIENNGNKETIPYPTYSNMTGLNKHLRCRLCVDATGELSDLSCGDAWLEKYKNDDLQRSIVLTRSRTAELIVKKMIDEKKLLEEKITIDEVIESQRQNIASKKYRQESRLKLYKILKRKTPKFDGGYKKGDINLLLEVKVLISHKLKSLLEKFNIYWIVYRMFR